MGRKHMLVQLYDLRFAHSRELCVTYSNDKSNRNISVRIGLALSVQDITSNVLFCTGML